jgi:LuxR family transcriptional regulator, maltose regulon positive regulatory protein
MTFALTKIQPPRPRSTFVARAGVQERLAEALLSRRLVLLCAPAGYGKTALLAQETAHLPEGSAVAWVAADTGDDLQRLLECMLAALEPFDPPWRVAPEALVAGVTASVQAQRDIAAEVINTLHACDIAHGVIVFDDVHRVEDPDFFRFLDGLIERLPDRWCVTVSGRREPPLTLARLRAADELAEVRQLQLQFSRDEARRLARQAGLDDDLADRLFDRTHGWPAGLRIAIDAMRGGCAASGAVRVLHATADRPLFEFLVTEVLEQLPPVLADFLLAVSVLADLDAARCQAVTGERRAAALLDEIERLGLFVDVLDAPSRTLRLHDLFREALQHQLRLDRPEEWRVRLQRAADAETDPIRCQALWLAAGCEAEAARALLAAAPSLNLGGAARTVMQLCAAFTPSFAAASAELQHALGLAQQTLWQLQDAQRHYAAAQELYGERGDTAAEQLAIARRAAVLAALGRLSDADELMAALPASMSNPEARMVAATAELWLVLERCEFDEVAARFGTVVQLQLPSQRLEDWQTIPPPRVTACRGVAPLLAQWGSAAMQVAADRPVPLRAMAQIVLGWSALWQARLAEAVELLARAEADADWVGEAVIARSHGLALRAVIALAQGDRAAAMLAMRTRVDEQPAGYGGWGLWHALFVAVRVAAGTGDADSARAWLARLLALHPTLPEASSARLHPARGLQGTLAWIEGRRDEARAHWQAALAQEAACDLMSQAFELRVRLAAACLHEGATAEAAAWLAPVLETPEEGPRGALFAAGELAELARTDWRGHLSAAACSTMTAWVQSLAVGLPPRTEAATTTGRAVAVPVGPERLTVRELEVLACIAAGDSNKLVARALALSLHTVKRHVANILGKLDVQTRGQAAAWYRAHVPPA